MTPGTSSRSIRPNIIIKKKDAMVGIKRRDPKSHPRLHSASHHGLQQVPRQTSRPSSNRFFQATRGLKTRLPHVLPLPPPPLLEFLATLEDLVGGKPVILLCLQRPALPVGVGTDYLSFLLYFNTGIHDHSKIIPVACVICRYASFWCIV